MPLKNRRILITAGPTWTAIDSVRVISNPASGATGITLAEKLRDKGAKVTLLLGPVCPQAAGKGITTVRFSFFDELKKALEKELKGHGYDAVIHSAAVSDYRPKKTAKGKISSELAELKLTLVRTPKLIDAIRRMARGALLVGFKFLPESAPEKLIAAARELGKRSKANLVVANTVRKGSYRAFVVSPEGMIPEACTKEELAEILVMYMDAYFSKQPHTGTHTCSCGNCRA